MLPYIKSDDKCGRNKRIITKPQIHIKRFRFIGSHSFYIRNSLYRAAKFYQYRIPFLKNEFIQTYTTASNKFDNHAKILCSKRLSYKKRYHYK